MAVASLSTIVCILVTGVRAADGSKASEFLTNPTESQSGYIGASAMMAGLIATQNNRAQAVCIDDFVAKQKPLGYPQIVEAMRKYGEYHPSAIIMGVLEKACGKFKFGN